MAMKVKNPVPAKPEDWLREITKAYHDARDAIPFTELIDEGKEFDEKNIFHFAPSVSEIQGHPQDQRYHSSNHGSRVIQLCCHTG